MKTSGARLWHLVILACIFCMPAPAISAPATEPRPIAPDLWLTAADNLPDAGRLGLEGDVSVDLSVSETGEVTDCRIVVSSGHSLLDEHTCDLLVRRAQFEPARDERGNPVPGHFFHSNRWQVITLANWAENGFVEARLPFDPKADERGQCNASIEGKISEYMKQMACFILYNQAKVISASREENDASPFQVGFILSVYPDGETPPHTEGASAITRRIAYAAAQVVVSQAGLRTDCRMIETRGPTSLIFPICGPTPPFRYVPQRDADGANVSTTLREEVTYYISGEE